MQAAPRLVIMDRDGTINEDRDDYVKSLDEWVPLPGALEAIARLNQAGWQVVVATNQSGLGRGLFDMAALNAMHARMHQLLTQLGGRIEAVFFCPHTPDDRCGCRKPQPGLFAAIADRFHVDLQGVPMVGDMPRDLLAGVAVGCRPHLVRTGQGARLTDDDIAELHRQAPGLRVHADLGAFADALIADEALAEPRSPAALETAS